MVSQTLGSSAILAILTPIAESATPKSHSPKSTGHAVETLARTPREIPAIRPAPRVVVGGPGWDSIECDEVIKAEGLEHACEEITQALGA